MSETLPKSGSTGWAATPATRPARVRTAMPIRSARPVDRRRPRAGLACDRLSMCPPISCPGKVAVRAWRLGDHSVFSLGRGPVIGTRRHARVSMDSLITAAARALAAGDPLGALNCVALRDDASALALRGIAMAQLCDLPRARPLLRRAARAFGSTEPAARARCVVAQA